MTTKNYENESIDIVLECRRYLLDHNFNTNTKRENVKELKNAILLYSIKKLIIWDKQDKITGHITSLKDILNDIDSIIENKKQKEAYFNQYIHCITYFLGKINNQDQILIKETNQEEDVIITKENDNIKEIIINKNSSLNTRVIDLLNKIEELYKEKVPVLKK